MKRIGALCIALGVTFQTIVSAAYPTQFGSDGVYGEGELAMQASSATSNIFYVDAHPFVLLDKDGSGNYFVIADEYYAKGGFANTKNDGMTYPQKFDINGRTTPDNRINAAVLINSEDFLNALPSRITDNIITYDWTIESASNFNGYPNNEGTVSEIYDAAYDIRTPYIQRCKIALPSLTELWKYQSLIGYEPSKSSTCLAYTTGSSNPTAWAVRTPLYAESNSRAAKIQFANGAISNTRDLSNALRPVFFLDKDFFKLTTIDSVGVGENVKNEILASVGNDTDALLDIGYSLADLINMGLLQADENIFAENVELKISNAVPAYTIGVEYDFDGNEDTAGTIVRWQMSDDDEEWNDMSGNFSSEYIIRNADVGKWIRVAVRIKTFEGVFGKEVYSDSVQISAGLDVPPNSTVQRIDGHSADAPAEYTIAMTEGGTLSLLDCVETDAGNEYFVTTNFSSGNSSTNALKFDPNDENSVAYALEKYMYESALTDSDWANWSGNANETCAALPSELKEHMVLHDYVTEASSAAQIENDYISQVHIALMSYNEFVKYYNHFGYYISSGNYWMLRTIRPDGKLMIVDNTTQNPDNNGRIVTGGLGSAYKIRPVFYLDHSFFTDVKLNVEQTGSKVKEIMLENYTRSQMKSCGYTDEELSLIGFETAKAENLVLNGAFEVGQTISVEYTYKNNNTDAVKNQKYAWYRANSRNGEYERIIGATGAEYTLIDADLGKYIKVVVTPLTSFMTDGEAAAKVSNVIVRESPDIISSASTTGLSDGQTGVTVDFDVRKTTAGNENFILIISVFDKEDNLIITEFAREEQAIENDSYSVTATGFTAQEGYYVKAMIIDSVSVAKPILTKVFR